MKKEKCKHGYSDVEYDNWIEDETDVWISGFEDIDTHRMKCKFCGKIEYYSSRAKSYYEEGGSSEGLFVRKWT